MDYEAEQALRPELEAKEHLLWAGRPARGLRLRASDWYMIPTSVLWAGLIITWGVDDFVAGGPLFLGVFYLFFIGTGLYMLVGRFVLDMWARSTTYYGVTDHRIIICAGPISRKLQSINLSHAGEMTLTVKANGSGSIHFGSQNPPSGWSSAWSWFGQRQEEVPAFEYVDDIRVVHDLIRTTQSRTGGTVVQTPDRSPTVGDEDFWAQAD